MGCSASVALSFAVAAGSVSATCRYWVVGEASVRLSVSVPSAVTVPLCWKSVVLFDELGGVAVCVVAVAVASGSNPEMLI